jgi:hypothetical protein
MATTTAVVVKRLDQPDEVRQFQGHGHMDVVEVAGHQVGRGTFEPGWRWSNDVRPIAGTDSCEVSHLGYCTTGRMRVTMDDGSSQDIGPGDVVAIPPGHDAEVVGNEECVFLDFGQISEYAKH